MAYESFRNWQSRSIEQKQSASTLLMGLAGGALGFTANLLSGAPLNPGALSPLLCNATLILNALSLTSGIAFALNRVRDFDLTAQVARQREKDPKYAGLKAMRATLRKWSRWTRRFYFWQAMLFWLGMLAFLGVIFVRYRSILFPS